MLFVLAFAFIITICGTASAATPQQNTTINSHNNSSTLSTLQTNSNVKKTVSKGDPIINGTVTINEYGAIRNLSNATVTVNSNSGRTLAITTTDAKGYYSVNFYSTDTQFKITTSYLGCNALTNSVTVTKSSTPGDPNYYGTSNAVVTPIQAWWNGNYGYASSIYITYYNAYFNAGEIQIATNSGSTTYNSYCIDIYTEINPNNILLVNGPLPGTAGNLSSAIDWGAVNYVISHYSPNSPANGLTSNQMGAAIQCAIWALTTVQYPNYNSKTPSVNYHFLTAPNDALDSSGGTAIRTEALAIASYAAAHSMVYPSSISVSPKITRIANGQPATITATVFDNKGNPLSGATVNFQTTGGKLSSTTGVTNSNGQVIVTLSNIPSSTSVTVTASVSGNYGNLLYDNPLDPRQNLVAENILPQSLLDISIINSDVTANVALSQTVNSPVNVGNSITYTVTATNNGPNTATGIIINDVLPSGFTATPSVGTYYNSQWVIPSLTSGSSATLTISGIATAAMAGTNIINTATETGQDQYNSQSPTSTASSYVNDAVLTISNTGTTPVNVGDTGKFTITATNNGPDTANNIQINDPLPTGFTYSATAGIYNPTTGIWTINSLASSGTATLTFTGPITTGMAGTTITNHATATWTEYPSKVTIPDSTINVNKMASIAITNTGTTPVNVGQTGTFTVTAINNGPNAATNLQINDPTPTGFTFGTPTVGTYNAVTGVWTINSLASGATATLTFTKTNIPASMAGTTTTNHATATWTEYPSTTNIPDSTIHVNQANLTITNTGTTPVNVGQTGIFTVTINNTGTDTANNIKITDILPNGFIASTTTGSYDGTTWTINSLATGGTATLTFTKTNIPSSMAGTTTTNTATATWTEYPSNTTIPPSTIHVNQANVTLSQTVNSPVDVGDKVSYIVTATNNGPDTATNININDIIPTGLNNVVVTPSSGTTYNNGVWTIPILTNPASATLTITGTATANMAGTNTTNTATRTNQTEYNNQPTTATANVWTRLADPILTQTVNGQNTGTLTVNVNDPLTFIITAQNIAEDSANNVNIRDIIPSGLNIESVTPSVGTYDINTGIWNIPELDTLETATLTITGTAGSNMAGFNTTNTATELNQTEYNPTPGTTTSIPIYTKLANVALNQVGNYSGNTVTFIVTATNNGPDNATNIIINNSVPAGLTNAHVTASLGTSYSNGVWTIPNLTYLATASLNITGTATPQNTINNTATKINQTEYDPNTPEISAFSVYVPKVDIRVSQYPWYYLPDTNTYLNTYQAHTTAVFIVDIRNTNSYDDASNVKISYTIGDGYQYIGSCAETGGTTEIIGNTIYWNINYLPKNTHAFMTVYLLVVKTGNQTPSLTCTANLLGADQSYNQTSTYNSMSYSIIVPTAADIGLNQTSTTSTVNGTKYVTYTITTTNNGPDNATGVTITDKLPTGLKYYQISLDGGITWLNSDPSYNPTTGLWTIGNFNTNDQPKTLMIKAIINTTGPIKNTATINTNPTQYDWNLINNAQTLTIQYSNPKVDIRVSQYPWYYLPDTNTYLNTYQAHTTAVFIVDIRNTNSYDDASNVKISYTIGDGYQYIGSCAETGGTTEIIGNTIYWNINYLPKNTHAFMTVYLLVVKTGNQTPSLTCTANLLGADQSYNQTSRYNSMSYSIIVPTAADIGLNQISTTSTVNGTKYVTYTITTTNNGPDNATGVTITDKLPTGLTYYQISLDGGITWLNSDPSYNPTTGLWTIGNFNTNDQPKTLMIKAIINTTGPIKNTATINTNPTQYDWNLINNAQTTVISKPN